MNFPTFKQHFDNLNESVYKTVYQTDRYGGNHTVGLTIEFVKLKKDLYDYNGTGESEAVHWAWDLILDGKRNIVIWRDEDSRGHQHDGGCYYLEKDEWGNRVLGDPIKDPEERDVIEEYIDKEWPLSKREGYIFKQSLSKDTQNQFGDELSDL